MRKLFGTMVVVIVMLAAASSTMGLVPYNAYLVRYYGGADGHCNGTYFRNRNGSVRLQCELCSGLSR